MRDHKPYCKDGESESHVAMGWAIMLSIAFVFAWFVLGWAIGLIHP